MKDDIQVSKHKGKKETSIIVPYIDHTLLLSIQCSFQILFSFRVYNAKCQNVLIIKNFLVQLLKLFSSYIVIIELYNQNKKQKNKKCLLFTCEDILRGLGNVFHSLQEK